MWSVVEWRRQGAGPRRKVSFRAQATSPLARASSGPGPSHVCTLGQRSPFGLRFSSSGRNTGSVSGPRPLVSRCRARPWKRSHKCRCVSERQAGSAPDEPVYSGQPGPAPPGWVQVRPWPCPHPAQTSLPAARAPQPCSRPLILQHLQSYLSFHGRLVCCVFGVFSHLQIIEETIVGELCSPSGTCS